MTTTPTPKTETGRDPLDTITVRELAIVNSVLLTRSNKLLREIKVIMQRQLDSLNYMADTFYLIRREIREERQRWSRLNR